MAKNDSGSTTTNVVAVVLLIIVIYQLYSGVVLQKIGIPGLFEIEFATDQNGGDGPDGPSAPAGPEFAGNWLNVTNTRGITRAEITESGNSYDVHLWGSCSPQDCDWGSVKTPKNDALDGALNIHWDQGFARETQTIRIDSTGRLILEGNRVFTDDSGRAPRVRTEIFARQ